MKLRKMNVGVDSNIGFYSLRIKRGYKIGKVSFGFESLSYSTPIGVKSILFNLLTEEESLPYEGKWMSQINLHIYGLFLKT